MGNGFVRVLPMRLDALPADRKDRACIAWGTPTRGERTFVEILGERVTVVMKGSVVRVILQLDGLSRVVTDFVESFEVRTWTRNRAPPPRGKRSAANNGNGASGAG